MKIVFEAFVRGQRGLLHVGKINSVKLVPFIDKKVKVTVEGLK